MEGGNPLVGKLVVVGVGLIGGSLAMALRRDGQVGTIVGVGRGRRNLDIAVRRGIIDRGFATEDPWPEEVADADLVLVSTPVAQVGPALARAAPWLGPDTVVTDAGSTKGDVVAAARDALGARFPCFVPAHPIAGTETSGAEAALPDLFRQRTVVVCAEPDTSARAVQVVTEVWRSVGGVVRTMVAGDHDRIFAAVSHLPHLLAFALLAELASRPDREQLFAAAGSGFRDFTRIAGSHPEIWRDICLANRAALATELDRYREHLAVLATRLEHGDAEALEAEFRAARQARADWLARVEQVPPAGKL